MRIAATLLATALIAGCSKGSQPETGRANPFPDLPPGKRIVATVEGVFDGTTLTLRPISGGVANALAEIPVVQDGTAGTNPPDTLELVTESMATIADGCGPGVDAFSAAVTARSFYATAVLSNVYFEVLTMSATGREACNSFDPAPVGISNQFGLFPYGTLDRFGTGLNASSTTWAFRLPDQSPFTFTGRIVADVSADGTSPFVASTVPAANTWAADGAAPISVTFSEQVDPLSVTITLGDGTGSYVFLPEADGMTFTYQEPNPGFPPGSVLSLTVSGAEDLQGNPMAQPFSATFAIGGSSEVVAAPGSSAIVNQAIASSFVNDLVAVWSDSTGSGGRLFAALKFAGQPWEAPVLLDEGLSAGGFPARAVNTTWGFLVVWSAGSATRAALFDVDTGAHLWTSTLWPSASDAGSFDVIQGYAGLAVVRAAGGNVELVRGASDGVWGSPEPLASHASAAWPRIVVGPEGFLRVFYLGDNAFRLVREDLADPDGWLPSEAIPGAGGFLLPVQLPPVAFPTATGIELVWADPDGGVFASEDAGTGFGAPLELSIPRGALPVIELAGSGADAYRAVAWNDPEWGIVGTIFEVVAWGPVQPIRAGANGTAKEIAMAESWDVATVVGGDLRVTLAYFVDPNFEWWDEFGWWADGQTSPARGPRAASAGPTTVTWAQQGASKDTLWWNDFDAQSPEPLAQAALGAEAFAVSAVVDLAGVQNAVWWDAASEDGSVSGAWYWPVWGGWDSYAVPSPSEHITAPATVARGESSWTFFGSGPAYGSGSWTLQGALSGEQSSAVVSGLASAPELAEAGHPASAVVAWADGVKVGAVTNTGGLAWTNVPLYTAAGPFGLAYPSAAAGGSGFLVGWRSPTGQPTVADPSSVIPSFTFAPTLGAEGPRVAVGNPVGAAPTAAVAWHVGGQVFASVLTAGPAWGTPTLISGLSTCDSPELASDGTSFLATFRCGSNLRAARFDGASWSTPFLVATAPLASSLAGAPSGFRVAAVIDDGGVAHAFQVKVTGTSAGAPERIDVDPGAVRPRIRLNADVGFFCAGWSQVASDPLAAQARARCFL